MRSGLFFSEILTASLKDKGKSILNPFGFGGLLGILAFVILSNSALAVRSSVSAAINFALAPASEDSDCAKSVRVISPFEL